MIIEPSPINSIEILKAKYGSEHTKIRGFDSFKAMWLEGIVLRLEEEIKTRRKQVAFWRFATLWTVTFLIVKLLW